MSAAVNLLDASSLLTSFGLLGIAIVLFAETGLLIGLFLPGDSLLFTAGLFAAAGSSAPVHLNLVAVMAAAAVGATAGAETGYLIGRRSGPLLLRNGGPRLTIAADRAGAFLERYGVGKAIVLARFVPLVRTVLNPLAGMVEVQHAVFTRWQLLGGLVWTVGVSAAGYALGRTVPSIDRYLLPVIALVVLISLTPIAIEAIRNRRARAT